jgi:hypothetical protein
MLFSNKHKLSCPNICRRTSRFKEAGVACLGVTLEAYLVIERDAINIFTLLIIYVIIFLTACFIGLRPWRSYDFFSLIIAT